MSQQNTFSVNAKTKQNKKVRDRNTRRINLPVSADKPLSFDLLAWILIWKTLWYFSCPWRGAVLIPLEYLESELNE